MLRPGAGRILFRGAPVGGGAKQLNVLRRGVGLVFQDPEVQLLGGSVEEEVSFGPMNLRLPVGEVRARVDAAIRSFALEEYRGRAPQYLSGGEKKAGDAGRRPGYGAADAFCWTSQRPAWTRQIPACWNKIFKCSRSRAWGLWLQRTTWISHGAGPPGCWCSAGDGWRGTGNRGRFLKMFLCCGHAGWSSRCCTAWGACWACRAAAHCGGTGTGVETMKQALLAVSFGTSVPRARQDIEAVERVLAAGAPERAFCRAYTSPTIRRILAERGEPVPGLPEALEALAAAGVEDAAVQPTHLLYGFEYDKLKADAAAFAGALRPAGPGAAPCRGQRKPARAGCVHGAALRAAGGRGVGAAGPWHGALRQHGLSAMQTALRLAGGRRAYMGTVEGWPGFDEVLAQLKEDGCGQALLVPFMLVAGDHALNDMAGGRPKSWKSRLEAAGVGGALPDAGPGRAAGGAGAVRCAAAGDSINL